MVFISERMRAGIHNYANEQIQLIGPNASWEILGKLRTSSEQFVTEIGAQFDSLEDVQGEIVTGVENMAQTVEYKLTENEERNNKIEQVPTSMYTDVQKITHELGQNLDATKQTNKGLVATGRKLRGLGENIRNEVWTSVNTLIQTYTEQEPKTQKESMVRPSHP